MIRWNTALAVSFQSSFAAASARSVMVVQDDARPPAGTLAADLPFGTSRNDGTRLLRLAKCAPTATTGLASL